MGNTTLCERAAVATTYQTYGTIVRHCLIMYLGLKNKYHSFTGDGAD